MDATFFNKDYFALFDLPRRYALDSAALHERYRALQRVSHPDSHAAAPEQAKRLAVQLAARVNEAYRVLKDPFLRARYWLELHNVVLNDEAQTVRDGAFLMTQMELRERLEELKQGYSEAEAKQLTEEIAGQLDQLKSDLLAKLKEGSPAEELAAAQAIIAKAQFFAKLKSELDEIVLFQN